jgi:hypothetical protein
MEGWAHARTTLCPDTFPSDGKQPGPHMAKYKQWMGLSFEGHAPAMPSPHMHAIMPFAQHRCLMRFRLCQWPLAANRLHHQPRDTRVCCLCHSRAIEDERHVLMACTEYDDIRVRYGIAGSTDMCAVMRYSDQAKLANCLSEIWARRSSSMAEIAESATHSTTISTA